jgi:hypothetical protein
VTEEPSSPADNLAQPSGPDEAGASDEAGDATPALAAAAEEEDRKPGQGFLHPNNPPLFSVKNLVWVGFFLLLTVATRCANYRTVFVTGPAGRQIFYQDGEGDCYSRMTRVRAILEHGGLVHFHAFENFPIGTWPHTTSPMDYLIVAIALLLKPFMADYIDMAGAVVSPLLGLLTTGFLALWARELNQQYRRLMLLLVALSPILVHGTELGRPRHQSLQIFLLAVGIGAELIMARRACANWAVVSGVAWGLALWVSLYEPLVMLVAIYVTKLIFYRPSLFVKERLWGLAVFACILGVAYALEGRYLMKSFAIEAHDQTLRIYFGNWLGTIGEMMGMSTTGMNVFAELLFRWVGFGLLVSPLLLIARLRDTKRSILLLALLVITFGLTLREERWGYFFALVYAMSLPWQLSLFKRRWLVWTLFLLSLWPVAEQWDYWLFDSTYQDTGVAKLNDQRRLRQAAGFIKEKAPGGILAPWWWSPQLAYWSGQPAVAGSSHESLAGIVDTARFFSVTDPKEAEEICKERQVETVVTGDPGPIITQSAQLLGQPLPPKDNTMADILWQKPHSAPLFLHVVFDNNVVKVFEVNHGSIVQ